MFRLYWEKEYVELVQKSLAQQADTAANEAVIQPKKPKDVAQSGDLSVLQIGRASCRERVLYRV